MASRKQKSAPRPRKDLREWCIEMAIRWPTITETNYGHTQQIGYGGNGGSRTTDADVIGRAKKIEEWVTGKAP